MKMMVMKYMEGEGEWCLGNVLVMGKKLMGRDVVRNEVVGDEVCGG